MFNPSSAMRTHRLLALAATFVALLLALPSAQAAPDAAGGAPSAESSAPGAPPAQGASSDPSGKDAKFNESELEKEASAIASLDIIQLFDRAGSIERELSEMRASLSIPREVKALAKDLPKEEKRLKREQEEALRNIERAYRWFIIADIRFRFDQEARKLEKERRPLADFAERVSEIPKRAEDILKEWGDAQKLLSTVDASKEAQDRIKSVIKSAKLTAWEARKTEAELARASAYFEEMHGYVESVLNVSQEGSGSLLEHFTAPGLGPLEAIKTPPAWQDFTTATRETFLFNYRSLLVFAASRPLLLAFQFSFFLALATILVRSARRRRYLRDNALELQKKADAERPPDEPPPLPTPEAQLSLDHAGFRHPLASAALVTAGLTAFLYQILPSPIGLIGLSTAILSSARLHFKRDEASSRTLAFGAGAQLFCLFFQLISARVPELDVWVLGIQGVLNLYLVRVLSKNSYFELNDFWTGIYNFATRIWLVAALLGLGCWAIGFAHSASVLINGTCRLMLFSLAIVEIYEVAGDLLALFVESEVGCRSRIVKNHGQLVLRYALLTLRVVFLGLWLRYVARFYTLASPIQEEWQLITERPFEVGNLSITLGDVLTLLLGIAIAIYSARLIRFLLTEEALPRTKMRIGTRAALTSGVYAIALGLGILFVLIAAGVELDKLTIVVSALGVGIGFGLQNIVQNFVSGVILVASRPVNVGDRVEVDGLMGTVITIGFRASVVRTFQGAEVIVPNSAFVTDRVINWSLSDDRYRIEINLGVAYGTPAQKVIDILEASARRHSKILKYPDPEAIFVGFGDSSLDFQLRCWIDSGGEWPTIKSQICIDILERFALEKIEIPFPQRDLHLRSVSEGVKLNPQEQQRASSQQSASPSRSKDEP